MSMNYKITLQYDGTRYDGWQKQGNTHNTIQEKLETILGKMCQTPIEVHGSGRTDAGVHALAQTANFHLEPGYDAADIMSCLNRYLPADIAVTDICEVPERFHSRLNAVRKTYRYRIHAGAVKNVFGRNYIYSIEEMPDAELMRQAAAHLVGEHDFKSFCSNRHMKKSTVRHLYGITINQYSPELSMEFSGNGFLYNMVRILAGTLLEVGLGHIAPDRMTDILSKQDRQAAGPTLPAQGLFLVKVDYG